MKRRATRFVLYLMYVQWSVCSQVSLECEAQDSCMWLGAIWHPDIQDDEIDKFYEAFFVETFRPENSCGYLQLEANDQSGAVLRSTIILPCEEGSMLLTAILACRLSQPTYFMQRASLSDPNIVRVMATALGCFDYIAGLIVSVLGRNRNMVTGLLSSGLVPGGGIHLDELVSHTSNWCEWDYRINDLVGVPDDQIVLAAMIIALKISVEVGIQEEVNRKELEKRALKHMSE